MAGLGEAFPAIPVPASWPKVSSRGWILPSLYLLTLSAVITVAYYSTAWGGNDRIQGWQVGAALFLALAYTQLVLLLPLAPVFSAGALTIEKEHPLWEGS